MTRYLRHLASTVAAWRSLAPFAALFVLLILFAVGGMLVVGHEADRSDAARAREGVSRTFGAILARLDSAAEMNAGAPPIASALSGSLATPVSAYAFLNFTSRDALGYYGVVVLNPDGTAFAGTRFGLPWTGAELTAAARLAAPVAARLPVDRAATVHALRRDTTGEALAISVANIMPGPGDVVPGRPRRMAIVAPVAVQLLPKILPSLGVEALRLGTASADPSALTIPVENGSPVVFVWRPRSPGQDAITRWLPAMGGMLLAALILVALAGRASLAKTRALVQLAHHDSLTGLANRIALREELDGRQARGESLALGMIDLNGFKAVNDQYGHLTGDGLLQAVAAELTLSARPGDFVARLGGDEFAWISPSRAAAERLAEDFAQRIAQPLAVGALNLRIGAATGIAVTKPGVSGSGLMAIADARLYERKHANAAALADRTSRGGARTRRTPSRSSAGTPPRGTSAPSLGETAGWAGGGPRPKEKAGRRTGPRRV